MSENEVDGGWSSSRSRKDVGERTGELTDVIILETRITLKRGGENEGKHLSCRVKVHSVEEEH